MASFREAFVLICVYLRNVLVPRALCEQLTVLLRWAGGWCPASTQVSAGSGRGELLWLPLPFALPALPPLLPRYLSRAPCHHPSPGDWGCVPTASPGRRRARTLPHAARRAQHPCPAEEPVLPTAAKYKSWGSESWLETSSPELSFLPRCLHAGI